MAENTRVLGIVLSGGAGSRAGGQDKGLIDYKGQPLVSHLLSTLTPEVDELVLCIHRNQEQYSALCKNLVTDESPHHEGPMAGIVAALQDQLAKGSLHKYEYLAVFPCDVLKLPASYLKRLKHALVTSDKDAAVAHDGNRRQNLHCMIRPRAAESLIAFYSEGGRAIHQWLTMVDAVNVDFSENPSDFQNLNSLELIQNQD